jgi:hypothetical protein
VPPGLGYRAEEIIGQHFQQFYPEDAGKRLAGARIAVAAAEGRFIDGRRCARTGRGFGRTSPSRPCATTPAACAASQS